MKKIFTLFSVLALFASAVMAETLAQPITEVNETISITINDKLSCRLSDATASQRAFQILGKDATGEYLFFMAFQNTSQVAGTYTTNDVMLQSTGIYHYVGEERIEIQFSNLLPNAVVTMTGNTCNATVHFVSEDSVLYEIAFEYSEPVAATVKTLEGTVEIEQSGMYDVAQMVYGLYAYDVRVIGEEYLMQCTVLNSEDYAYGTFNVSAGNLQYLTFFDAATQESLPNGVFSGTLTVDAVGNDVVVSGSALTYGDIKFEISATGDRTPVDVIEDVRFVAFAEGHTIVLNGAEGQMVTVYDMAGRAVMNCMNASDVERIDVEVPGVYAVCVGGETMKVLVR